MISLKGLGKSYLTAVNNAPASQQAPAERPAPVLNDINLEISQGEFVVFVGRSGSGKSTLLNLVGAMDTPDRGELSVDGIALSTLDDEQKSAYRREKIGFIFQAYNLIPTLTVAENLQLPLQLSAQRHQTDPDAYLARLGMTDRKDYWPDQLSGGEQQRVAVIRALIHEPSVLIADEPTGNLDDDSANAVIDLLLSMIRERQTTLLLATHNMALCEHADRVYKIEAGKLHRL